MRGALFTAVLLLSFSASARENLGSDDYEEELERGAIKNDISLELGYVPTLYPGVMHSARLASKGDRTRLLRTL